MLHRRVWVRKANLWRWYWTIWTVPCRFAADSSCEWTVPRAKMPLGCSFPPFSAATQTAFYNIWLYILSPSTNIKTIALALNFTSPLTTLLFFWFRIDDDVILFGANSSCWAMLDDCSLFEGYDEFWLVIIYVMTIDLG